jgi:hypothetical protein
MQLAISQNPHVKEPGKLWEELDRMDNPAVKNDELDKEGFMALKNRLKSSRSIKVN